MKNNKNTKSAWSGGRSAFLLVVTFIFWLVIIGVLFDMQVLNSDSYREKVIENVQHNVTVKYDRGIIYDANGVQLATNEKIWRVFICPKSIETDEQAELISTGLAEILDVEYDFVYEKTQLSERADETIKKEVDETTAEKVKTFRSENDLEDKIYLEESSKRVYPYNNLASNTIGFTGTDGGLAGLELYYDDYLTGTTGTYVSSRDGQGDSLVGKNSDNDMTGAGNIYTTIDVNIQRMLEEQLKADYEYSNPLSRVCGIVMDPEDGAIKAIATYPDFNLNDPWTLDDDSQLKLDTSGYEEGSDDYKELYTELLYKMWSNKAISELYEPGSTFKVITTAMALEEGVVELDEEFTCTGYLYVEGYDDPIHCHRTSGHGTLTFRRGLQQSCNPTLMQVGLRLGVDTFYDYLRAFGFMEKTGVDLPGESTPYTHSPENFGRVQLAVYSFGQTFKVTPIRQLTSICCVANGGNLVEPYIVEKIVDDEGNVVYSHSKNVIRQVVSEDVCDDVSDVLQEGVSTDGGAKNVYIAGYKVAGKTGTSEVRDVLNDEGEAYLRVGSTVAYAPYNNPELAVLIVCDSPQCSSVYGSVTAAPYVANVLKNALPYLGVEKNYTATEEAVRSKSVENYLDTNIDTAYAKVTALGLKCIVVGDGSTVTKQVPAAGELINYDGGRVVLYTGGGYPIKDIAVGDFSNATAANAIYYAYAAGLNINLTGNTNYADISGDSAIAISQSPAAGTLVSEGTVVTVDVRFMDGTIN